MTTLAPQPATLQRPAVPHAWTLVCTLGIAHLIIDAASIFAVRRMSAPALGYEHALWIVAAYNFLAFALQPFFGWIVDRLRAPTVAAAAGAAMVAAGAVIWSQQPMLALWLVGLGNALFHVGAGSICLNLARGHAAMPGVFVGPGDLGVVLGVFIGDALWPGETILIAACAVTAIYTACLRPPPQPAAPSAPSPRKSALACVIPLLILVIAARQLIGGAIAGPWLNQPQTWLAIMAAAMLGKIIFGFAADRLGWLLVTVPLAALAAPFLAWSSGQPAVALLAMLLVQASMPVTLAALSRLLPRHPAWAFGIASASLFLGALPAQLTPVALLPLYLIAIQLAATAALAIALAPRILRTRPHPRAI